MTVRELYNSLTSLAEYQNAEIWLINRDGEILIDTESELDLDNPDMLSNFNLAVSTDKFYRVGTFYGHFSQKMLSVMVPVTSNMSTRGYLAIHYRMSDLYDERESMLGNVYLIGFVLYISSFLLLALFSSSVYNPLKKIITGANEYAAGNLNIIFRVETNDEMGYLASTLNYMSGELAKSEDYQHTFISNVSHDFRSPLTSIKGYTEVMLDGTIPVEMQEKYLNIIL